MTYPIDEEILDELVGFVIQGVHKDQVVYTLCAMREESEDDVTKAYFQKAIDEIAAREKYCPKCGCELSPVKVKEYHTYLDDNAYETVVNGYYCELCDCKFDY